MQAASSKPRCYSIFELSVNTTSGAPSFVPSLRKGRETTDIHRNCNNPAESASNPSMAKPPIAPVPDGDGTSLMLDKARFVAVVVLLALLVLCVAFSWTTRDAMAHLPFLNQEKEASGVAGNQKNLVDLRPWQTAEALAPLAVTAEETDYAREAEHLADHEVDQAFASALRVANLKVQHTTFTGEALALSQKVEQLKQLVAEDQAQVQRLTSSLSSLGTQAKAGKETDVDNDNLEIAKAQLGLDSDLRWAQVINPAPMNTPHSMIQPGTSSICSKILLRQRKRPMSPHETYFVKLWSLSTSVPGLDL